MKKEFLISTIISSVACVIAVVAIIFALLPDNGEDGKDGVTPTIEISADGYLVINGEKTDVKADGATAVDENPQGLQFCMQDDGTYIVSCGDAKYLSNIVIPETYKGGKVVGIADDAFAECIRLESITIPDSVTSIGDMAFYGCTSLTSIVIPDSVTSIGSSAFYNCESLDSVTIGDSVKNIGSKAFIYCTSLKNVYYTGDIAGWCNIEFVDFYATPMCYATNLYINGELVTDIAIPNSVTSIGNSAFYGCTSLTSITIPDSVTSIGVGAFYGCTSLTSITIPDSVTSIGECAFYGCTSLTSIVIPDSVTSIGYSAFRNCAALTIYCEAASKPSGWDSWWNYSNRPVVWGYKGE